MTDSSESTTSIAEVIDKVAVSNLNGGTGPDVWVGEKLTEETVKDLLKLVWGEGGPERENLHRWSQGFAFSPSEQTALVQMFGGPCAVIAPVQAYLLRNSIYGSRALDQNWRAKNGPELLTDALVEMFALLSSPSFVVVLPSDLLRIPSKRDATTMEEGHPEVDAVENDNPNSPTDHGVHSDLKSRRFSTIDELKKFLTDKPSVFTTSFGILRFLYSFILSKTIAKVREDLEDPTEPLIDAAHGHGNQCLTNLLITGQAVCNVWDDVKEFGGLRLQGIPGRPAIGYLSLLESLRYVEVGFYLKCPQYPIWILASETHLSIVFALIRTLVESEAEEAAAIRAFKNYDEHGSGFISADKLKDVLETLNLFREDEYVNSLKDKMDKDKLDIILRSDFLAEFFPHTAKFNHGRPFDVYHYNGLARPDNPVHYHHGMAKIIELDLDVEIIDAGIDANGIDSDSSIVRCLRTNSVSFDPFQSICFYARVRVARSHMPTLAPVRSTAGRSLGSSRMPSTTAASHATTTDITLFHGTSP
ncbi:Protein FAM188A [Hypsibius exemplaris]|uniref:Ubiquitin carboxyl-terminal hydrolase MINDY n=1 Tax=Hypsibius exemplaris TaxID=2072580 RepID=A0A1W0WVG6_HYPEX|nr:Protein FAM188A [Hypsibius exemplaris]